MQILSAKNEEQFVRNYGLDFYPLDVDIKKLMKGGDVDEMAKGNNPLKFITGHLKGSKNLKELMVKTQEDIWDACEDADLIIFHTGTPIGFFLTKEKNRKKHFSKLLSLCFHQRLSINFVLQFTKAWQRL